MTDYFTIGDARFPLAVLSEDDLLDRVMLHQLQMGILAMALDEAWFMMTGCIDSGLL